MTDLGGNEFVRYLNCGEVFMDLTYSNANPSIHFKYVPCSIFQLYLNEVESRKKKDMGLDERVC